jgi:hypothetical protein
MRARWPQVICFDLTVTPGGQPPPLGTEPLCLGEAPNQRSSHSGTTAYVLFGVCPDYFVWSMTPHVSTTVTESGMSKRATTCGPRYSDAAMTTFFTGGLLPSL